MHSCSARVLADGGIVVDTRPADSFGDGHALGTLNIPLGKSFSTWAGWLVPYDRDVYLIAATQADAARAAREMAKIGLDRVAGWFPSDALAAWADAGGAVERVAQTSCVRDRGARDERRSDGRRRAQRIRVGARARSRRAAHSASACSPSASPKFRATARWSCSARAARARRSRRACC